MNQNAPAHTPDFYAALVAWQEGRAMEAERLCLHEIESHAPHADSFRLLAEILAQRGDIENAVAAERRVLSLVPDDAAAERRLAQLHGQRGDRTAAIEHLQRALALEPDNPRALNNLGKLQLESGNLPQALQCLERALALRPDYPVALNNLGIVLARLGRNDEAVSAYLEALQLRPRFAEAHINLAGTLASQQRIDEALAHHDLADAIDSPPPDEVLAVRAELLIAARRFQEALDLGDALLQRRPTLEGVAGTRVAALRGLGREEDARGAAAEEQRRLDRLARAPSTL